METIVAYAFDRFLDDDRAAAGVSRVEAYYSDLWRGSATRAGRDAGTVGLHSWSNREPRCNWPTWNYDGLCVASLHAPVGYEAVVGDLEPGRAAVPLARAVISSPARLLDLAPPFVLAVLDPAEERLELFTDAIGLGRLYQLRTADGWVWSNRPVAACLFAGVPAAAAARGWRYAAGCGWFMGDTTPYDRVLAIPGATRIVVDGRRARRMVTHIDPTSIWSGPSGKELSPRLVEETADALRGVARSVSRLWPDTPTVDLSGGRDSRVVAAAFLSAGVDLRLNSYDAVPGEVQVAEDLVAALPYEVEHVVTGGRKAPVVQAPPALPAVVERIERWHRYGEGLRPASYLFHTPPDDLAQVNHLAIGGAGGEVAHGHFYPRDVLTIDQGPLESRIDMFTQRLQARLIPETGPAAATREAVGGQIQQVLRDAVHGGFEDAKMLDYFYVVERLRRWGTAGERSGVVSPLLVPAFVRSAFTLTTAQRLDNALHRAVVQALVPQWAGIGFFTPQPAAAPAVPARVKRLAETPDRELVESLLTTPGDWLEDFDAGTVRALWALSAAGRSTAADEVAIRQLLWRAVFEDHLNEINRHITPRPSPPVPPVRREVRRTLSARLKQRLRRHPAVQRLVRSRALQVIRQRRR